MIQSHGIQVLISMILIIHLLLLINFIWLREEINNLCSEDVIYCTDTVVRITTWKGKVGLMYPSEPVYI